MARAQSTDFLHSFRWQVVATSPDGTPRLQPAGRPQAGFSTTTLPEVTIEGAEYREGTFVYTRKQPGVPTVSDCSLQRGTARLDTSFWDWARVAVEGSGEVRADVDINHFHRDTALNRDFPTDGTQPNLTNINVDAPAFAYHLRECLPIRCKPAGDLDATSSEINLMEFDFSVENFEVEALAAP